MNSCGDNIKVCINGIVWKDVGWSQLTQFRAQCWAVINLFRTKMIVPWVQTFEFVNRREQYALNRKTNHLGVVCGKKKSLLLRESYGMLKQTVWTKHRFLGIKPGGMYIYKWLTR